MSVEPSAQGKCPSHISRALPTVTWLMCTHVSDDQLQAAIESCLAQTFTDFELIVVANGDAASAIAADVNKWFGSDPRVRVLTTEVRHLNFSLTFGLHHARASLIARMDSDDICTPDRLIRQVKFMTANPDVVVLGTAYELIDATGGKMGTVRLPVADADIRRALRRGNPFCHPSVMFRRSKVLAAGGYLGGVYAQDYDLWIRLAADRCSKFANLPEVCLHYRAVGVGGARKSRLAYASAAASQFHNFASGAGVLWGVAALSNAIKATLRGFNSGRKQ